MPAKLAACPRCRKPFLRDEYPVCADCEAEEEADYRRVGKVLNRRPGLNAAEVAEQADVPLECVLRMLQGGRIESDAVVGAVPCGRCGAPAISSSQRLCHSCLAKLDTEYREAKAEIQRAIQRKQSSVHEVRRSVNVKRGRDSEDR